MSRRQGFAHPPRPNIGKETAMSNERKVDTVRLQGLSRAFMTSASLFAAIDLELFTAIATGDNTVERFAKRAGITDVNADRLMGMCAAAGLIRWVGDHVENAEDVERYLVKDKTSYAGAWLTFMRPGWKRWGELTEHLRSQEPPTVIGSFDAAMTVDSARRYHEATQAWASVPGADSQDTSILPTGRRSWTSAGVRARIQSSRCRRTPA